MSGLYDLNLTEQSIVRETEKAVCFIDGSRERWIPRKVLTWMDRGAAYCPSAAVPMWFAKANGMVSTARNFGH